MNDSSAIFDIDLLLLVLWRLPKPYNSIEESVTEQRQSVGVRVCEREKRETGIVCVKIAWGGEEEREAELVLLRYS